MLIVQYTPPEEYTDDTLIKDLGDSLEMVLVFGHIEGVVGKDLDNIDTNKLHTVRDVINLLEQRINPPSPNPPQAEKVPGESPGSGPTSEL